MSSSNDADKKDISGNIKPKTNNWVQFSIGLILAIIVPIFFYFFIQSNILYKMKYSNEFKSQVIEPVFNFLKFKSMSNEDESQFNIFANIYKKLHNNFMQTIIDDEIISKHFSNENNKQENDMNLTNILVYLFGLPIIVLFYIYVWFNSFLNLTMNISLPWIPKIIDSNIEIFFKIGFILLMLYIIFPVLYLYIGAIIPFPCISQTLYTVFIPLLYMILTFAYPLNTSTGETLIQFARKKLSSFWSLLYIQIIISVMIISTISLKSDISNIINGIGGGLIGVVFILFLRGIFFS